MNRTLPFTVRADIDLGRRIAPYLTASDPDVTIVEGDVPHTLEGEGSDGPTYRIRDRRVLLTIPNGVRILIEDGRRIVYAREKGQPDNEVALFVLGIGWGALCYQRGLIPLHASAVIENDRVYAFTGHSGAGKSTLAAALSSPTRPFFTDDVLILDPARLTPEPLCFTGQKDLKLWDDAIAATAVERTGRVRSVEGFEKYFAAPHHAADVVAGQFAALFMLGRDPDAVVPRIAPITGGAMMTTLLGSLYRPAFGTAILGRRALFAAFAKIAGRVPVLSLTRAFDAGHVGPSRAAIDAWIAAHGAP